MSGAETVSQIDSHPAQKLLRELLDDPLFHDVLTLDVKNVAAWLERGLSSEQRERWNALSEDEKAIRRKRFFNDVTDEGNTFVSAFLRTDLLRRRREGLVPMYNAILEARLLARISLLAAMN